MSPAASEGSPALSLRRAASDDAARVLAWNNAADVRAVSLDPRAIGADEHAAWFAGRLGDPHGRLWVALVDDVPAGVVRINRRSDDRSAAGRISIVVDPAHRGRGLGRRLIALACAADGGTVAADILADNFASRAAFEAAGFVLDPDADAPVLPAASVRYLWRPSHVRQP